MPAAPRPRNSRRVNIGTSTRLAPAISSMVRGRLSIAARRLGSLVAELGVLAEPCGLLLVVAGNQQLREFRFRGASEFSLRNTPPADRLPVADPPGRRHHGFQIQPSCKGHFAAREETSWANARRLLQVLELIQFPFAVPAFDIGRREQLLAHRGHVVFERVSRSAHS